VPHPENQCLLYVNDFLSCTLGNHGIVQIYEIITELLTAIVLLNTNHEWQNIDVKITDVTTCKVIKKVFLDGNKPILIKYNYHSAKAKALYKSTDGPAGQHADYPPKLDRLGHVHQTIYKLTVRVYWRPWPHIWRRYCANPDLDPKWRSGTIGNTGYVPTNRCELILFR